MGSDGGRVDARAGRRGGARPRNDAGEASVGEGHFGGGRRGAGAKVGVRWLLQVSEGGR